MLDGMSAVESVLDVWIPSSSALTARVLPMVYNNNRASEDDLWRVKTI